MSRLVVTRITFDSVLTMEIPETDPEYSIPDEELRAETEGVLNDQGLFTQDNTEVVDGVPIHEKSTLVVNVSSQYDTNN